MDIKYHIGHKCNLNCKYCTVDQNIHDEDYDNVLYDEVDKLEKSNVSIDRLLITGGEPSLYKDRIYKILERNRHLKKISIVTNGTDLEFAKTINSFSNVALSISWDGLENDRSFNSLQSIKEIVKLFPEKLTSIEYVIENSNYHRIHDDMCILNEINPKLVDMVQVHFVVQKPEYYKIDLDVFKKQVELLFRDFRGLNIFNRDASKRCPHESSNNYMLEIENGEVRRGCIRNINSNSDLCKSYNDKCSVCDIDTCIVCLPALMSMGLGDFKSDGRYYDNMYCRMNRVVHEVLCDKNKEEFFKSKLLSVDALELVMTTNCNMRCTYCYQGDHSHGSTMEFSTIDNIINLMDLFRVNGKSIPKLTIIGGEVMFGEGLDKLEYLINKLIEHNMITPIYILTNGYMVNDRVLNIYKKLVDCKMMASVQISLDCGNNKDTSRVNINGESTYDTCMDNIKKISDIIGYKKLSVNTVVDTSNIVHLPEHCKVMDGITGKLIGLFSIRLDRDTVTPISIVEADNCKRIFKEIIDMYNNGEISLKMFQHVFNIEKLTLDNSVYFNDSICGTVKSFLSIDPNGNLTTCNAFINIPGYEGKYVYGTIRDGLHINDNVYKVWDMFDTPIRRRSSGVSCECCECIETCYGSCRATNALRSGNMNEVTSRFCKFNKIRWKVLKDNVDITKFKIMSSDEIDQIKSDIDELKSYYLEEKDKLTSDDEAQILILISNLEAKIGSNL